MKVMRNVPWMPWRPDWTVYVGPWAARITLSRRVPSRFPNGSRWFSGWRRWRGEYWL